VDRVVLGFVFPGAFPFSAVNCHSTSASYADISRRMVSGPIRGESSVVILTLPDLNQVNINVLWHGLTCENVSSSHTVQWLPVGDAGFFHQQQAVNSPAAGGREAGACFSALGHGTCSYSRDTRSSAPLLQITASVCILL
jgi:hypothetical protein